MRTGPECILCFMRQAQATVRLSSDDPAVHRQVMHDVENLLPTLAPELSPPENAVRLYGMIAALTGTVDPFSALKEESNTFALSLKKAAYRRIATAADSLLAAVRFAIGGNIIDYAAQHSFDAAATIAACQEQSFAVDEYGSFRAALGKVQSGMRLLYLADNCGEIVFDGLLVEQLQKLGCQVTLAVRGRTIINDAVYKDALHCGLTEQCRVITNGTGCPGTPLADCSQQFREHFFGADLIISKGMGNFETLSEIQAPLFFLFTVKCSEVARCVNEKKGLPPGVVTGAGEMVLMQQEQL